MVLLRRSGAVGTHAGLYNGPSGHPEPKNLGLDDVLPDPSRELSEAVRRELFQSALDEVVAETGVAVETLSEPVLMGIMVDSTQKPDALFFVRRDFRVLSSRERKEELLLAVKSIRMRQMSRERAPRQVPPRARSVKSESDVPTVVVKSLEDCASLEEYPHGTMASNLLAPPNPRNFLFVNEPDDQRAPGLQEQIETDVVCQTCGCCGP
eukprot:g28116.t1